MTDVPPIGDPTAQLHGQEQAMARLMARAFDFILPSGQGSPGLPEAGWRDFGPRLSALENTGVLDAIDADLQAALSGLDRGEREKSASALLRAAKGFRRCQEIWPEFRLVDHAAGCSCCLTRAG